MPVNEEHPLYTAQKEKVKRTRDCYEGSDAIKSAGETYLPRLDEQSDKKYNAYKSRGLFLPVIKPTSTAFIGAIMRKEAVVELPQNTDYMRDDTNNQGRDLGLLSSMVIKELLTGGRAGVLVEHNGERSKLLLYPHESIINWSDSYIILMQEYTVIDPKDKFKTESKTEYLELTYDEDGYYIQNIWRNDGKNWHISDTIIPTNRGERLDYLPFTVANTLEVGWDVTDPALLDIADINIDHYRLSTDLRHGLHYTALPTMFLFGEMLDNKGDSVEISVGAGSANHITDPSGKAELLEFTGAGLGAIKNAQDDDVKSMASIGAKMLQDSSAGVKAAETARIEASGESATLSTIANSCEALLTQALTWASEWEGGKGEVSIKLNRDFLDTTLTPQELTALLQTWQGGGMSLDTFLNNLQQGEILPKGATIEEEKELILAAGGKDLDLDDYDNEG
ncbi:MAG: DUF4055 domain-containing protein [Psychromonas sp.]|nr:DUF4055 domain-containing protein [Psychromonas sp.]